MTSATISLGNFKGSTVRQISFGKQSIISVHTVSQFQIRYEGHAKSSVTNRLPWFYPRYILKCFTALEWCVE